MKSILLDLTKSGGSEGRFRAALDLARAFDAHISCLQAVPVDAILAGVPFRGAFASGELLKTIEEGVDEQRAVLEARLRSEGVSWGWVRTDETPAQSLIDQSRLADIIVLSLPSRQGGDADFNLSLVSHVAIHARSPVLAIPADAHGFDCRGPAIVAWNGSMESSHAARLAVPLLQVAGKVHLVEVAEGDTAFPVAEGARYLSRHGIPAEVGQWPRNNHPISEALLDAAASLSGSYLVAGAYGHTRFREAILGGVSRELMLNSPLPLVLAH